MTKQRSQHPSKKGNQARKPGTTGVVTSTSAKKTAITSSNDSLSEMPLTGSNDASTGSSGTEKKTSSATSVATKQLTTSSTTTGAKSSLPAGKSLHKGAAKYERRQSERQQRMISQRRAARTKTFAIIAVSLVVILIGSLVIYFAYHATHPAAQGVSSSQTYTEAIYNSDYQPIDNIYCDAGEGSVLHIHVHASIYINGQPSLIPQYVGIPTDSQTGQSTCFYWLHTHDTSGVVHIESPITSTFAFGQFLQVWNRGFNSLGFPSQLLLTDGWTVYVNGQVYKGDFNNIQLQAHTLITMAYNSPNVKPDTTYAWNGL